MAESIDHVENPKFLNMSRKKKHQSGYSDQISTMFGTVPYGDYLRIDHTAGGNLKGDSKSAQVDKAAGGVGGVSLDYEEGLKSPKCLEATLEELRLRVEAVEQDRARQLEDKGVEVTSVDLNTNASEVDSLEGNKDEDEEPVVFTDLLTVSTTDDTATVSLKDHDDTKSTKSCDDDSIEGVPRIAAGPVTFMTDKSTTPLDDEVASNIGSSSRSPKRTSVKVRRPPGGECSDIFNLSASADFTSNYARPCVSLKSLKTRADRIPWGTEEDLRRVPTQVIPQSPKGRLIPPNERHPFLGKTESARRLSSEGPSKVNVPYGTDTNFTKVPRSPKHANHKTVTPWHSDVIGSKSAMNQSDLKSTESGRGEKISSLRSSISQIPF